MEAESLRLDAASARSLLLLQAVDEADPQGRLIADGEREQLEHQALEAARAGSPGQALDRGRYLRERAARLLAALEPRQPAVAALRHAPAWQAWLPWLLGLGACLLGAAIDRIDNPRQVNMLSPPLLAVLLWNVAAYLALLASPLLPRRWREHGLAAALQRWLAGRGAPRRGGLRADITLRFHRLWWNATAAGQAQWIRQLLHATAAGWGAGLALSIVLGGLVREYRVGWESTLLEVEHVHAFLSVLFAPVVALLPMEAFTLEELRRMAFSAGAPVGVEEARRWVWLYLALLVVVVIVPRLLLAGFAALRRRQLARAVRLDLRAPYFADVLSRVSPARVVLCLLLRDAQGGDMLLRALLQASDQPVLHATGRGSAWTVLSTSREDELRVLELPAHPVALAPPQQTDATGWMPWIGRRAAAAAQPDALAQAREGDVVLAVVSSPAALRAEQPLLQSLGKPVLVLVHHPAGAVDAPRGEYEAAALEMGLAADVLPLEPLAGSWLQDQALRDAIRERLPARKAPGFARIAAAWNDRNQRRFEQAMRIAAGQLLHAARQVEDLQGQFSLKRIVSSAERDAAQRAREAAMERIVQRLREAESQALAELLRLHGVEQPVGTVLQEGLGDKFVVQQAVDSPQAGMAGAATGAAMGAGIDLLTGGLTLGAAAALGALVGGTAAFTAAHWKNRGAPGGGSQVQLGDEMLQSLAETALLRYLCVIHFGRRQEVDCLSPLPSWKAEVVAAVEAERPRLQALWSAARAGREEGGELHTQTAQALQAIVGRVLARSQP